MTLQDLPSEFVEKSLSVDDLNLQLSEETGNWHALIGFRLKNSRFQSGANTARQETFTTMEYDNKIYEQLGFERARFLAAVYEKDMLAEGRWTPAPTPRGMSGGGLFEVVNGAPGRVAVGTTPVAKLAAIFIECRQPKKDAPGVLLGTRIGVHLGLIAKYCPRLSSLFVRD
ncbi:MAG TPA: hypothetical protein VHO25_02755 [Polyangiaceae bacterium]|nr:hypothetical protein [Polyangiaceae bacterium]